MEQNNEYLRKELKRAYEVYAANHNSISKMIQVERIHEGIDRLIDESNAYKQSHEKRFSDVLKRIGTEEDE